MTAVELTAIAGVIAAVAAIIGLLVTAVYRFGKLTEANKRIPAELRVDIQRNHDQLDSHEKLVEERFLRHEKLVEERFLSHEKLVEERFLRHEKLVEERFLSHEKLVEERFLRHEELIKSNEQLIRHNQELIRHVEELVRIEAERTREQIRNLHQAIMSHSHDEDGNVMFRVPPPESDQQ